MMEKVVERKRDRQMFLVGDKVMVGTLKVEINGFATTSAGTFAVTDYGNFNIDILEKHDQTKESH